MTSSIDGGHHNLWRAWLGIHTGKALEAGRGKGEEQTILKLLQFIGAVSGGKSVTQVALAYLMAKGGYACIRPWEDSALQWKHSPGHTSPCVNV